jgi:hypothetical protein
LAGVADVISKLIGSRYDATRSEGCGLPRSRWRPVIRLAVKTQRIPVKVVVVTLFERSADTVRMEVGNMVVEDSGAPLEDVPGHHAGLKLIA